MGDPRSFPSDQEAYQQFLADGAWCRSRTRRSTCRTRCPTPATDDDAGARRSTASTKRSGTCRSRPAPTRRRPRPRRAARARRGSYLAQGDAGFYTQVVKLPPDSRRRCTATTTPRCSWCSRAAANSTASRWRASTSRWSTPNHAVRVHRRARRALVPRRAPGRRFVRGGRRRDRLRPHRPRRAASSTAPGSRAGGSTSVCVDGTIAALARLDDDDGARGDRRRRHDRRARHRRRAHALRPADHVRPLRDRLVLPRRHHRGRRQLRLLGRAVQARGPRRSSPGIFARVENMDPIALSAITWDEFETFPEFLAAQRRQARRQLRVLRRALEPPALGDGRRRAPSAPPPPPRSTQMRAHRRRGDGRRRRRRVVVGRAHAPRPRRPAGAVARRATARRCWRWPRRPGAPGAGSIAYLPAERDRRTRRDRRGLPDPPRHR